MVDNLISNQIKKLRKSRGWTQPQLADKLSVSKQTVSNWETGLKAPRMGMIEKMADLFNVKVSELVGGDQKDDDSFTVDEAVDHLRAYQGKPISDSEKEVLKDIIKGYLDRR